MNPRRLEFVRSFIDPSSETHGKGTESYMKVYGCTRRAAGASAAWLMANPEVKELIQTILNERTIDFRGVIETINRIVTGEFEYRSETESYDEDGELVSRLSTTRTPKPSELLSAINILNRMAGVY